LRLGGSHLAYCTNIHPGESWIEIRENIGRHLPAVKALRCPDRPMGVGLRLSSVAAETLSSAPATEEFEDFLEREGLYVFTINGFPYGDFHGTRVKENVYLPDWGDDARVEYSNRLADLLARWVPEGETEYGSVSTVPGAFKSNAAADSARQRIVENLLRHAAHLQALERASGRRIVLALEPEPCCMLETVEETVRLFEQSLYSGAARKRFATLSGCEERAAESILRRHLGVCLDLCHSAVEFEDPQACVGALQQAGIPIAKLQVTAGLRIPEVSGDAIEALREFDDGVYLHQVVESDGQALVRYRDIGQAVEAGRWRGGGREWRVHFHVPVFLEEFEHFGSTQTFLREVLARQRDRPFTSHLEVETYTWNVLPARHRNLSVDQAISRELEWLAGALA